MVALSYFRRYNKNDSVCVQVCTYASKGVWAYAAWAHANIQGRIIVYVHMYVHVYIYIYIYIYMCVNFSKNTTNI